MRQHNKEKIYTRNFWQGEDITKKFIYSLVKSAKSSHHTVFITSVFPKRISFFERLQNSLKYRVRGITDVTYVQKRAYGIVKPILGANVRNVWFTGENHRIPNGEGWDAFLSFEPNKSPDKNLHLPFWVTRLGETCNEVQIKINEISKIRDPRMSKTKFACAFIGNPEPTRLRFIEMFARHFEIDLFGTVFGNPVKDKKKILQEYKFNVCFENDLYPGYVTEKAIESWECEAIPIWWGLDKFNYLNSAAIIDVYSLGFEGAIEKVREISNSSQEMKVMRSQPILNKRYDVDELLQNLKCLLA